MTPEQASTKYRIDQYIWTQYPRFTREMANFLHSHINAFALVKSLLSHIYGAYYETVTDVFGARFFSYGERVRIPALRDKLPKGWSIVGKEE